MRVVLDTHVWIWYLLGDSRLTDAHRRTIEDQGVELWISAITVWEAHLLIERGRLPVTQPASVWIPLALRTLPVREAAITFAIATRSRALTLMHEDPADRFIAATAVEMKAPLLTSDDRLLACPQLQALAP